MAKKSAKVDNDEDEDDAIKKDTDEDETEDSLVKIVGDVFTARMQFYDAIVLDDAARVRFTKDGYLVANPRIARTGIQEYTGAECGIKDKDIVRVYRPENEVFSTDAVRSYTHLPLTNDHPPEMVTPANWKKYAVGDTGDEPLRDGASIRVPMMMRDAATIKEYKDGKRELSVGYTCDIQMTSGVTDTGEAYDAIQRNIRANHLAVVTAARGGSTLNIGDNLPKETKMKTVQVDGISCEMSDTAAEVVRKTFDTLSAKLDEFKKKVKKGEEEAEQEETDRKAKDAETITKLAAKDAEIATLKKQLDDSKVTPAMLDAMHTERTAVIDSATKLLPKEKLVVGGQTTDAIRKQVVSQRMGDVAKDWTDAQIAASFAVMAASLPKTSGPMLDAVNAFMAPHVAAPGAPGTMTDARDAAYDEMIKRQEEAWKPKVVA
jgi:uncharacterized protein